MFASSTFRSRLLCPHSSSLIRSVYSTRAPLAGHPPRPIVRSSRFSWSTLYCVGILCKTSTLLFWETPRSVSLACVCLIDNMRWKHLAVLFVRRRTRFFELMSFPLPPSSSSTLSTSKRSFVSSWWSLHTCGNATSHLINGKFNKKNGKKNARTVIRTRGDSRIRSQCTVSSQRHYFMFLYQSCSV